MLSLRRIIFFLLFILLCCASAFAVDERVAEIVIKGNQRTDTGVITRAVTSKVGEVLNPEKVNQDLKNIYRTGFFNDVSVDSHLTDKGVVLTFTVSEKPFVREIKIIGNKEISVEKIREAITLKPNSVYTGKDIAASIKKVRKLYADDGYYLAEVTANTETRAKNEVRVVFRISEGKKVLIKNITFEGNKAFSPRKLRKAMQTKEKWFLSWLTGAGTYKEEALRNDTNLIAELYYNNGYINVKVGEPSVKLLPDNSGLVVTIAINEGEQFKTGEIDFKGDLLEDKKVLRDKVKLVPGKVFNRSVLRDDIGKLTDLYGDKGYAFANVNPLTKVDPEKKTVDITFDFDKGDKVHIGRINITGNTKTRDKVIRREFKLAEGDQYSTTALRKSKQNLSNLGFFEEVNIATAKGKSGDVLDINAEVKEKSTGSFSIGGGFSSADGILGQASISQSNFLGLGLKATLAGSLGSKSQTYTLGLTDPYFLDTKWTLGFDIYRSDRDYIDFTRRVTGGDIKAGYPLTDQLSTLWMYRYENKKIFNLTPSLSARPELLTETSGTIGSLYASLTFDTTDYRIEPSKGLYSTVSAEYAGLGGDQRFMRFLGESTYFVPFKWNTVFSLRGTLGYIVRNGRNISIDERFYLGGINSVRGYATRSISPYTPVLTVPTGTNVDGVPSNDRVYTGGTKQAIINAEYVFPIIKDAGIKGVGFFDAGNSYGAGQGLFSTLRMSYGLGLRWYSPMGPLRIEYGIPLNPRTGIDSNGGKVEFSIGGFF